MRKNLEKLGEYFSQKNRMPNLASLTCIFLKTYNLQKATFKNNYLVSPMLNFDCGEEK